MSRIEKWIVRFAIFSIASAFFLNFISNRPVAEAVNTEIRSTIFRWEEKQTEKDVWNILRTEFSETATAAIMGNMEHESGICPFRYEGLTYEESYNLNQIYRDKKSKFIYSKYGYGLCGWTGSYNLEKLWNFCYENGYEVDSVEGQVRFLLHDLKEGEPMCYARLQLYDLTEMMYAVEDFRQSYEQSICTEYSQYKRGKAAKTIYAGFCEDIYTIETVSQLPYNFDIYNRVKELNKIIKNTDITG